MNRFGAKKTAPLVCVTMLAGLMSTASALRTAAGQEAAEELSLMARFVSETTVLVIKVDSSRLALPGSLESEPDSQGPWKRVLTDGLERWRTATGNQTVYATIGIPLSAQDRPLFLFARESPLVDQSSLKQHMEAMLPLTAGNRGGALLFVPVQEASLEDVLDRHPPDGREDLAPAVAAVAEYPIQVLLLPPNHVRRTLRELMPELPRQVGGGPSRVLTEGLLWAALGCDPRRLEATLVVQSASETAAQEMAQALPTILRSMYDHVPQLHQRVPNGSVRTIAAFTRTDVDGDRVIIRWGGNEATRASIELLATAVGNVRERIGAQQLSNNFKQVLLAMHNYHDVYAMFPPGDEVRDQQGQTGLSWRVHLLPFLGEHPLYQEFHLDEPWDSPHNRRLLARMPDVFRSIDTGGQDGHTTVLAPEGEDTIFGGDEATRISGISDGTSNTIAIVQVKPELAVPWTKPADYRFPEEAPASGLAVASDGRFLCAFADGSVRRIPAGVSDTVLLHLLQKSDGHPIDYSEIR